MINATAELLESVVGQHITVTTQSGTEGWRVVSVKRREQHGLRSDQPFNVYLAAPASNDRRQGTRTGTLPDGQEFSFFGVPIAFTASEVSYELVFN